MPRTITWKKGMKLSAEIFNAADSAMLDAIRQSVLCATSGRYGLYKSPSPFEVSLNITSNIVEVISCTCHAVTRSGALIDINFDSSYANTFDSRMTIPTNNSEDVLLLVIRMHADELRSVNETYSEVKYTFELIGENSPIDDNSLPIAAIVDQYGWRMNENDFVPPCITINAHPKYMELWRRATEQMTTICQLCAAGKTTTARTLLATVWHSAKDALIRLEKEKASLTPEALLATVQTFISDFNIGCEMDEHVSLDNAEPFEMYANLPLNQRTICNDIEKGLSLCAEIALKIEIVGKMIDAVPEPTHTPKLKPTPKTKPAPQPDLGEKDLRPWIGYII